MARSIPIPYYPNPVPDNPDDLPRFLEDEFQRIRSALIAQPVGMVAEDTDSILIGTVENWGVLFINTVPEWDVPGGDWNPATGAWTCPQADLYALYLNMQVDPFGAGNKNYYAGLRIRRIPAGGGPDEYYDTYDGGDDNVPLGVSLQKSKVLAQGDVIYFEGTAVHENQAGSVAVEVSVNILGASR